MTFQDWTFSNILNNFLGEQSKDADEKFVLYCI